MGIISDRANLEKDTDTDNERPASRGVEPPYEKGPDPRIDQPPSSSNDPSTGPQDVPPKPEIDPLTGEPLPTEF